MVEEFDRGRGRARQLELNFFGALWVSQAVLPHLRAQGCGHIVQISSIGALGGFPSTGLYSASKFALEGMSEALAAEAAPFGVKVTHRAARRLLDRPLHQQRCATPLDGYDAAARGARAAVGRGLHRQRPALAAEALLTLVDSDDPPLRLLLGSMIYDLRSTSPEQRMETWRTGRRSAAPPSSAIPQSAL